MSQIEVLVRMLQQQKPATEATVRLKAYVIRKIGQLIQMSFTEVLESAGNDIEWFKQRAEHIAVSTRICGE